LDALIAMLEKERKKKKKKEAAPKRVK